MRRSAATPPRALSRAPFTSLSRRAARAIRIFSSTSYQGAKSVSAACSRAASEVALRGVDAPAVGAHQRGDGEHERAVAESASPWRSTCARAREMSAAASSQSSSSRRARRAARGRARARAGAARRRGARPPRAAGRRRRRPPARCALPASRQHSDRHGLSSRLQPEARAASSPMCAMPSPRERGAHDRDPGLDRGGAVGRSPPRRTPSARPGRPGRARAAQPAAASASVGWAAICASVKRPSQRSTVAWRPWPTASATPLQTSSPAPRDVAAAERVVDRAVGVARLLVPGARAAVERGLELGSLRRSSARSTSPSRR